MFSATGGAFTLSLGNARGFLEPSNAGLKFAIGSGQILKIHLIVTGEAL
jgi:hypothetical protein